MTIKKEKTVEELVILEWEDEELEENLSWMIEEKKPTVVKVNNKKQRRKK